MLYCSQKRGTVLQIAQKHPSLMAILMFNAESLWLQIRALPKKEYIRAETES